MKPIWRGLFLAAVGLALALGCTSGGPPIDANERARTAEFAIFGLGSPCSSNSHCQSGFCVDAVCCNTACGGGVRDNLSCSNFYGNVPGLVDGTCTQLQPGQACGSLVIQGNRCTWRGTTLNSGNNCPNPPGGDQVCYECTFSSDCVPSFPVCVIEGGDGGCMQCDGNFGSATTRPCPTAQEPVCFDGACLQCSASNSTACTGTTPFCDIAAFTCVGCDGDHGSGSSHACPEDAPACLGSGECVECSASNSSACTGTTPSCMTSENTCGCTESAQCPSSAPVCDLDANVCVTCEDDFGSGNPLACPTDTAPACVEGRCRQCSDTNTSACTGLDPSCDTDTNACECESNAQCPADAPVCDVNEKTCEPCDGDHGSSADRACPTEEAGVCDGGECKECSDANNDACGGTRPLCLAGTSECGCTSSAQCPADAPVCNGATNECEPCNGDRGSTESNTCPTASAPACVEGRCEQCSESHSGQCSGSTPVCDTESNTCTCLDNADCPANAPVCNDVSRQCEPCDGDHASSSDNACPSAAAPACVEGRCEQCSDENLSLCTATNPECSLSTYECGCSDSDQCPANAPICNVAARQCEPCNGDFESETSHACPTSDAPACVGGRCEQCSADNLSACTGAIQNCNTVVNKCGCSGNVDCPTATPICNQTTATCEPCDGDFGSSADHACPSATAPACVAGSCEECSATNTSACTGDVQKCNTTLNQCGCTESSDCPASAPFCDTATATCEPCDGDFGSSAARACPEEAFPACVSGQCQQCSSDNTSACATNQSCNPSLGQCGCSVTADCPSATPVCNMATGTCTECDGDHGSSATLPCPSTTAPICSNGRCGQCSSSNTAECPDEAPACNVGTASCVECTEDGHCAAETPFCDQNNTCVPGCLVDDDCTGAGSICSGTPKRCVPGCRGTGKSTCPSGLTCTSTTDAPGTCSVPASVIEPPSEPAGELKGGGLLCSFQVSGGGSGGPSLLLLALSLLVAPIRRKTR